MPFYRNTGTVPRNVPTGYDGKATERCPFGTPTGYVTVAPGATSPDVPELPPTATTDLVETPDPSAPAEIVEGLE